MERSITDAWKKESQVALMKPKFQKTSEKLFVASLYDLFENEEFFWGESQWRVL